MHRLGSRSHSVYGKPLVLQAPGKQSAKLMIILDNQDPQPRHN
jgi:hypothetical protein